jgi:hypothetical protein
MLVRLREKWEYIAGSEVAVSPFLDRCLSLGAGLLRSNPDTFERTVSQLLDVASYMTAGQIEAFFSTEVATSTFTFQQRFDELLGSSNYNLSRKFAIHINENSLFSRLSEPVLIPPSILEPDKVLDREDPLNRKNVFFATGSIDDLSVFLAGHALLRSEKDIHRPSSPSAVVRSGDLPESWADDPTEQRFSRYFSLAKVDLGNSVNTLKRKGVHDIESPVRPLNGYIDLIVSKEAVRFDLISLPATVLLPEQRKGFERESSSYRAALLASESKEWSDVKFEKQYALTRHAELTIKLALLELCEQQTVGDTSPPKFPDLRSLL